MSRPDCDGTDDCICMDCIEGRPFDDDDRDKHSDQCDCFDCHGLECNCDRCLQADRL